AEKYPILNAVRDGIIGEFYFGTFGEISPGIDSNVGVPRAFGFEQQQLRSRRRQQPFHEPGRTALDGGSPACGYPAFLDPVLGATLDEEKDLSGKVRIEVWQPASPRVCGADIDAAAGQIGQGRQIEFPLQFRERFRCSFARSLQASGFKLLSESGQRWAAQCLPSLYAGPIAARRLRHLQARTQFSDRHI
ncbi:hypothetical protein NKJ36_33255, partial [Mesorhizobium sp. M0142]|uniref:hypothetical protein n=1 Tax=Mesorhizobium sp. M0142 TaxID=2956894 RepID=UPI003338E010